MSVWWTILALCGVYFTVGWLTFSLFFLSLVIRGTEGAEGRLLIEIANGLMPYLLPGGVLLLGLFLSGAVAVSLLFRREFLKSAAHYAPRLLFLMRAVAVLAGGAVLLRAGFLFYFHKGAVSFDLLWAASAGAIGLATIFLTVGNRAWWGLVERFLRLCGGILTEARPLLIPSAVVASITAFLVASAIGNTLTIVGLLFLPFLWFAPELDPFLGGFLDAHPFVSYLFITSWEEFIWIAILIPCAVLLFLFVNTLSAHWFRAFLIAAGYEWYRGAEPRLSDAAWTASARLRPLVSYSRPLVVPGKSLETRFAVQAMVVQKSSVKEAMLSSLYIASAYIPAQAAQSVFFVSAGTFLALLFFAPSVEILLLGLLSFSNTAAFFALWLVLFLVIIVPSVVVLLSAGVYYHTFLYGWCLDQEFPKERVSRLPGSVQPLFRELHTTELAVPPPHVQEAVGDFRPTPPEQ